MIGVILWCDPNDQKAVIWCEDQGDLAFLSRHDAGHLPDNFIDVGDVVEFDVVANCSLRLARGVRVVECATRPDLPANLQNMTPSNHRESIANKTAEIIPFCTSIRHRPVPENRPGQIRQG